jgi:hypothetical protein
VTSYRPSWRRPVGDRHDVTLSRLEPARCHIVPADGPRLNIRQRLGMTVIYFGNQDVGRVSAVRAP